MNTYINIIYTYTLTYRMDLNFHGTTLLGTENFAFFTFLFLQMAYHNIIINRLYKSILICALHISHITKHVWAA